MSGRSGAHTHGVGAGHAAKVFGAGVGCGVAATVSVDRAGTALLVVITVLMLLAVGGGWALWWLVIERAHRRGNAAVAAHFEARRLVAAHEAAQRARVRAEVVRPAAAELPRVVNVYPQVGDPVVAQILGVSRVVPAREARRMARQARDAQEFPVVETAQLEVPE